MPETHDFINPNTRDSLNSILEKLVQCKSDSDLAKCDEEFRNLLQTFPDDPSLLYQYNEFRIANLIKLPKRPQILISGPFGMNYPTTHQYPLFEVADVICLNCSPEKLNNCSTIHCSPYTLFLEIMKRFPPGFSPDFYWDNQVEQRHFIPHGIEIAPFPIVASVCHTFLYKTIEHICTLFDLVLPISKSHTNVLKKKFPDKILEFPFGLNWASFEYLIRPSWNKSVDVCLTFGDSESPVFPHRSKVIELTKKFKEKYGNKFSVEIASGLPLDKYTELLRKSRIAINVSGIHGPYNYRTIESMCAGSMVFQLDWKQDSIDNSFSELFTDGVHGIGFTYDNFESKLLYYLENKEQTEKIARDAYAFLKQNYSYRKLYQELIQNVKERGFNLPRSIKKHSGYHHVDMVYFYQNDLTPMLISYGVVSGLPTLDWIAYNNFMVSLRTFANKTPITNILTALLSEPLNPAERADTWSMCCKFYKKALEMSPKNTAWIIEWNFLLLSLEKGTAEKIDIENFIRLLEATQLAPFDELKVTFKYYVDSVNYPAYQQKGLSSVEFINLNLGLMEAIDNPQERVRLHHSYALKAAHYFLSKLH